MEEIGAGIAYAIYSIFNFIIEIVCMIYPDKNQE